MWVMMLDTVVIVIRIESSLTIVIDNVIVIVSSDRSSCTDDGL